MERLIRFPFPAIATALIQCKIWRKIPIACAILLRLKLFLTSCFIAVLVIMIIFAPYIYKNAHQCQLTLIYLIL